MVAAVWAAAACAASAGPPGPETVYRAQIAKGPKMRLAAAIGLIGERVREDGGLVRICGLSGDNLSRLQAVSAAATVPHFGSRAEAVGGHDHRGATR
jgi:hypothetical protein